MNNITEVMQKQNLQEVKNMNFKFGDIIIVDFGYNVGSEQNKIRPAVVLKQFDDLAIVMPIASKLKKSKTHVGINKGDTKIPSYIPKEERRTIVGCLIVEQIKTINLKDVKTERPIGLLLEKTKAFLKEIIKKALGLEGYYNYTEGRNSEKEFDNKIDITSIDSTFEVRMKEDVIKRGEMIDVNYGETNIESLNGIVKSVVISPNYANKNNKTIIVSPIIKTDKTNDKTLMNHLFYINENEAIDLSIIRVIDKVRVVERFDSITEKQTIFMDMLIENIHNLNVLFEYKVLKGINNKKLNNIVIL